MNINGHGHSFIDLGPRSLRFDICNLFSLETVRLIEAQFQVKPPWYRETKIYSNGSGHMTNMASMPIYGKKS